MTKRQEQVTHDLIFRLSTKQNATDEKCCRICGWKLASYRPRNAVQCLSCNDAVRTLGRAEVDRIVADVSKLNDSLDACENVKYPINDQEESSMYDWAKKEVDLAIAYEKSQNVEDDPNGILDDYASACYDSALKAFKSLTEDGHSGFSIGITRNILNRLIDGKPLSPILDTPENWSDVSYFSPHDDFKTYQCKRHSGLFKYLHNDGYVEYSDVNRAVGKYEDSGVAFSSGHITKLIDRLFPVTFPYSSASKRFEVVVSEFLAFEENGDWDTSKVEYIVLPSGEKHFVNVYFAEKNGKIVEIDKGEYNYRFNAHLLLRDELVRRKINNHILKEETKCTR